MRERFIDVEESNALGRIVAIDRLQTGDVTKERRSRETAEDEDRVATLELSELNGLARGVVRPEVGQWLADGGCIAIKAMHDAFASHLAQQRTRCK